MSAVDEVDVEAARARTAELYADYGRAVSRICRALLRNRPDAEDAAQQVFLSAHRALLGGAVPRDAGAWLATIARRECWTRSRALLADPATVPAEAAPAAGSDPPADALRRAEVAAMWRAIGELPRAQRDALLLREIRGLSYDQLSQELVRSGASVRSLLTRARRRLQLRLQDVHAGLGSATWLETLARLLTGGTSSPVAPATRALAIGIGAAAISGGAIVAPTTPEHRARTAPAHAAAARPARVAPTVVATPRVASRAPRTVAVATHRSRRHDDRVAESGRRDGRRRRSDDDRASTRLRPAVRKRDSGSSRDDGRVAARGSRDGDAAATSGSSPGPSDGGHLASPTSGDGDAAAATLGSSSGPRDGGGGADTLRASSSGPSDGVGSGSDSHGGEATSSSGSSDGSDNVVAASSGSSDGGRDSGGDGSADSGSSGGD